jgi:hypothetical protein
VHGTNKTNKLGKIPVLEEESCSRTIMQREGGVQDCSRTAKSSCTTQDAKLVNEIDRVRDMHNKSGTMEKNFSHLVEVEL